MPSCRPVLLCAATCLALSACGQKSAVPAGGVANVDCDSACKRVAGLRIEKEDNYRRWLTDEADEGVDRAEAHSAEQIAEFKHAMIDPEIPGWDPKAVEKLRPQAKKTAYQTHEWEQKMARNQLAQGIENSKSMVATFKADYEDRKAKYADWHEKAIASALGDCIPTCKGRPPSYAQCLAKTHAAEDAAICQ